MFEFGFDLSTSHASTAKAQSTQRNNEKIAAKNGTENSSGQPLHRAACECVFVIASLVVISNL